MDALGATKIALRINFARVGEAPNKKSEDMNDAMLDGLPLSVYFQVQRTENPLVHS
jgi:hypothetical protein